VLQASHPFRGAVLICTETPGWLAVRSLTPVQFPGTPIGVQIPSPLGLEGFSPWVAQSDTHGLPSPQFPYAGGVRGQFGQLYL
jgi:hypothetical protein